MRSGLQQFKHPGFLRGSVVVLVALFLGLVDVSQILTDLQERKGIWLRNVRMWVADTLGMYARKRSNYCRVRGEVTTSLHQSKFCEGRATTRVTLRI